MNTDEHDGGNKMDQEKDFSTCTGNCKIINALKKQKNFLPAFAWGTYSVALIIALLFVFRTFYPKDAIARDAINVTVIDSQENTKELSAEGKAHLKEQLHTALTEVSARAESAYNDKFATLVTILTVFGIAWPLIIGWIQSLTFKQEIKKIKKEVKANHKLKNFVYKQQKEAFQLSYDFFLQSGDVN